MTSFIIRLPIAPISLQKVLFAFLTEIQELISRCIRTLKNWMLMAIGGFSIVTKIPSLPMAVKPYESIATVILFLFKNFKEVFVCSK